MNRKLTFVKTVLKKNKLFTEIRQDLRKQLISKTIEWIFKILIFHDLFIQN